MKRNIVLTADSTCDLGEALKERYKVRYFPYHILLDGQQYTDGVDIKPDDLYQAWYTKKILPTTAAANPEEYTAFFRPFVDEGCEVVHLSLGSALSSGYPNAVLAASEVGHVYVIDSCSLSSGIGLLVLEAAERIEKGMEAQAVAQEVASLVANVQASFVVDTLEFLHAGGRCSALASVGSNLLRIKPSLEVKANQNGVIALGKKYMGDLGHVLVKYTTDLLRGRSDIKTDHVFITHSGIAQELIDLVKETILKFCSFSQIHISQACCTIASHCGPNTLGVLFMTKG